MYARILLIAVTWIMLSAACAPADELLAAAKTKADVSKPDPSEAENPHVWKPKVRSVAVFKNGMGFFMREGEVAARDGWALARQIPPAAFGTLAIYSLNKDEVVDVVGSGPGETVEFDGIDAAADNNVRRTRLEACRSLGVQLTYKQQGAERTAAGKMVSISGDYVVLESNSNSFAVPLGAITRLQVLELPLRVHVASDKGEAAKPPAITKLGMAYLRKGIVWIPEYSLKVIDEHTAELTLRGTVINEAEDLVHCDVNFVVGVPHFTHSDYMAPIAVGQVIRTIGAAVAPRELQSQIMNRAAITSNMQRSDQFDQPHVVETPADGKAGNLQATLGNLPKLESPGSSDYTVYTKADMTLRCGERAIVTLFVKRIRYSHLYRWSPPEPMRHFLVLRNDTDTAWTTGPCLAISGDRPLSEDLLKYTPRGGQAELPVTAAINISHEKTEAETDRRLKAHSPSNGTFLDLVTLSGDLRLKNFERVKATVVVEVSVPGKPIEAGDGGKLAADPDRLELRSRAGTIRWVLNLDPDESKVLRYKYERFVPSN